MSMRTIVPTENAYAEQWRQWQLANAESSRKGRNVARLVFAAVLTALAGWLGLQLLASPLWA
jgi:hypothetical protein